jgi:ABC-type transporter Mla subunit MlaD
VSSEEEVLVNSLESILGLIESSKEQMEALLVDAADMSEEWDLEIVNEISDLSQRVEELIDDLNVIIEEARANLERSIEDDESFDEDEDEEEDEDEDEDDDEDDDLD